MMGREDDEARALGHSEGRADDYPELPLGIEAFRSPLHAVPSDRPASEGSQTARKTYYVVASLAVALGVLSALSLGEPSAALTEVHEELVKAPALPEPAIVPPSARDARTGAIEQHPQNTSAPATPLRTVKSALAPASRRDDAGRTSPARRGKRRAEGRAPARTKSAARKTTAHPSRSAVLAAMRSVTSDARSCLSGTAVAQVHITFRGETGEVQTATVRGVQGAAASCVARAVRAARLPPFSKAQLDITFPFRAGG